MNICCEEKKKKTVCAEHFLLKLIIHREHFKQKLIKKDNIIVTFDYAPNGLLAKDPKIAALFIAGADKTFYPADARIEGNRVFAWSKFVKAPLALRFSFSNAAIGNLFSKEGLPVCPFRTDDWAVEQLPVK